jgi:hypothetical protein
MINWFRKEKYPEYRDKLLNAFPKSLKSEVEAVLNIIPFNVNHVKLTGGQIHKVDNLIDNSTQTISLDNQTLVIPYRLCFNEPDSEKESKLTETQKTILDCIYSRHHDGDLRQRSLEKLLEKYDYWVIPFTIQLLGEYVYEILEVLDKHVSDKTINNYERFTKENPKYWEQTKSRMISYWNKYYRRKFSKLEDYLGWQIADRIKRGTQNTSSGSA